MYNVIIEGVLSKPIFVQPRERLQRLLLYQKTLATENRTDQEGPWTPATANQVGQRRTSTLPIIFLRALSA